MKITKTLRNYEIIDIANRLNNRDSIINSKDTDKKLPVRILWTINGNVKAIKSVLDRITEAEQKINEEYFNEEKSNSTENGQLEIKAEYRQEFIDKKKQLMEIENEVEITMIKLDELESFNFVPSDFASIEFMVTDEE